MKTEFPILNEAVLSGLITLEPNEKLFKVDKPMTDYALSQHGGRKNGVKGTGPLVLPYPECTFEVEGTQAIVGLSSIAVTEETRFEETPESAAWMITVTVAARVQPGWFESRKVFLLMSDSEGQFVGGGRIPGDLGGVEGDDEAVFGAWMMPAYAALFMVGLSNCKNVTVQTHQTAPRGGRKSKRVRPTVEYRTINLPSALGCSLAAGSSGDGADVRLHTVRGHFKTFTAESPLLGKHTGTYWWGWQSRGSAEHGEIVSTYKYPGDAA